MGDLLAALRRDLHELERHAEQARGEGAITAAVLYENDAAEVEARIAALDPEGVSA